MLTEDDNPRTAIRTSSAAHKSLDSRNLDFMSVAELEAYVVELQAEITRVEAEISKKSASKAAAEAFFRV